MVSEIESTCRSAISRCLDALTSELTVALRRIVAEAPAEAATLFFEYQSPHFDDGFPVMYWFAAADGSAFVVRKVLPGVTHTIPTDIIYDPKYEAAALDTWAIGSELFVDWFAASWGKAGGSKFTGAAFIAHHDSAYAFDLHKKHQVAR